MPPIEPTQPIFFDASGRRASRLRRLTRVLGVLTLLYVGLLVASLVRVPGTSRISLPAVGQLFPEASPSAPPSVENAPNVRVVAAAGRPSRSGVVAAKPATATTSAPTTTTSVGATTTTANSVPVTSRRPDTTSATAGGTTATTTASPGQGPDGTGAPGHDHKPTGSENNNGRGGGKPR